MTTFIFDGHHGEEVISSQQSADINTGLYGAESYVLPVGSQFEPTIVSNNEVTIQDGICSIQGHRGGLDYGQSQSFTIENGTSGMMRSDLLIIRYTKDETTLVESFSFHTIKGTAAASDPEDPDITEADIRDGALVTEAALYRVHIDGLSIVAVERIWEYPESMPVSEEGAWAFVPLIAPFELTLPAGFDEDSFFRYGIFDGEKRYFAYLNPTSAVVADTALGTLDSAYRPAEAITLRTNLAGVTVTISTAGVVKLVTPSVPAGLVCKSEIIGENSLVAGLTYKDIDKLVVNAATDIANIIPYFEYSADEKVIGMIGDYYHCVKMVDIGALPNASAKNVNHGISNLHDLISIRGSAHNATYSNMFPLPSPHPTASNAVSISGFDSTKFIITTGMNLSGFTGFVVLEYTRS